MGWHTQSRYADLGLSGRAHYIAMGDHGPAIILLHGILVSSWSWRFNLQALSRQFRVYALCQKGHGWSDKGPGLYTVGDLSAFVCRFMDHVGIERAHLVGNSLGGAVALRLALDMPDRVGRLVLVDPAAVPHGVLSYFLGVQSGRLAPLYRLGARPWVFRAILKGLVYRGLAVDRHYMQWFMAPLRARGAMRAAGAVTRTLNDGLRETWARLDDLQAPTLLIWGRHDRLVPLSGGHILARKLGAKAQLEVFEDSGHCPMEEEPERFNLRVVDFLSQGG